MRFFLFILALLALIAAVEWLAARIADVGALREPGRAETYLATKAKRWIIGRRARSEVHGASPYNQASAAIGGMIFRGTCATCHGIEGRVPTDLGRWMYPRSPDLGSSRVQQWSDAELFWIIKHGIRQSGMPGFGKTQSDEQIWHLVHYVRSLGQPPPQ